MSATERVFPTFCHLVEYGTAGYQHMHRLLAFSAPLNLWAPSSLLVKEAGSIRPKRFLQYVEDGLIRVLGREPWLTDPAFRASHVRRDEAPWDRRIDDALKRILRNDERLPVEERRVVAAPPEKGMTWAQDFLAENPAEVDRWFKIFSSPTAANKLPVESFESARRHAHEGPAAIARWILRGAYNHGEAVQFAGAKVPLLLSSADRRFLKVLDESQLANRVLTAPESKRPIGEALLGRQLLEVLRQLDIHAGPRDLDRFLRGQGRRELIRWLADLCDQYQYTPPSKADGAVLSELRRQLDQGRLSSPLRDLIEHPVPAFAGAAGLALSVVDLIQSPSARAIAGMAASAIPIGAAVAKKAGLLSAPYTGPQWPFMYAYRSAARGRQLQALRHALTDFK